MDNTSQKLINNPSNTLFMGWNPDRPPLEYLERRLKYYKKRRGQLKGLLTEEPSEYQKKYYGGRGRYIKALEVALDKNADRQKEYIDAINILKQTPSV